MKQSGMAGHTLATLAAVALSIPDGGRSWRRRKRQLGMTAKEFQRRKTRRRIAIMSKRRNRQ